MLKKSFIAGAALAGLLVLGYLTPIGSYMTTLYGDVSKNVQNSVPLDFEIKRAKNMIADLKPEIKKAMHVIAEQEVALDKLETRIAEQEVALQKQKNAMGRLSSDLKNERDVFVYASKSYTRDQVRKDLAHRLDIAETLESTLEKTRKIRDAKNRALTGAQKKLENMLSEKKQLEVEVENLEAELRLLEAAQAASDFNVDDSHLARTKEVVENIRTRIKVASTYVNNTQEYTGEIQLDEEAPADIEEKVTSFLRGEDDLIALDEAATDRQ